MHACELLQAREPPVVLSAGFPDEDDDVPAAQLLEIEEALLSFTRAALAQGRRLMLPADRVVALLVAQTAAEYALLPQTEMSEPARPLIEVVLTEGRDAQLEQALAGLNHVRPHLFGNPKAQHTGRHRLTSDAVREIQPASAVVLGGARQSLDDVHMLREFNVRLYVVGATLAGPLREHGELWEHDITERMLAEIDWGKERGEADIGVDVERQIPYPYLMQRLVQEWRSDVLR